MNLAGKRAQAAAVSLDLLDGFSAQERVRLAEGTYWCPSSRGERRCDEASRATTAGLSQACS